MTDDGDDRPAGPDDDPGRADQYACTAAVLDATPDAAVVANLGHAAYVLAAVAPDRPRNVPLWGSMGVTTAVGLGVALRTDDPVAVLDGDGSLMMSLGVLATVARRDPPNLVVVVWDNEAYGTTGGQRTHGAAVDLAGVARECGLPATTVADADAFEAAYRDAAARDGAAAVVCRVDPVDPDARPPFDTAAVARRARDALTGE